VNTADPALDARIAAFAAAVRARLDDLDPEDVDDLTGGLEADLQEEAADHDGALELGDPVRYADELRTSAGLPERAVAAPALSPFAQLTEGVRERGRELHARIRANRELSAALDLLLVFRPLWWLLRAWAGYQLIAGVVFGQSSVLPRGVLGWLLLAGLAVISVQWGRGRWARSAPARAFRTTVSTVTALALVVLIPFAVDDMGRDPYVDESAYSTSYEQPGLSLDGKQVTNLFAYDPTTGESVTPSDGAWNVFPLRGTDAAVVSGSVDGSEAVVRPPFAKALPLDADPDATPSATPSPADPPATDGGTAETPAPGATATATPEPAP
jgi:hypothetical protein